MRLTIKNFEKSYEVGLEKVNGVEAMLLEKMKF